MRFRLSGHALSKAAVLGSLALSVLLAACSSGGTVQDSQGSAAEAVQADSSEAVSQASSSSSVNQESTGSSEEETEISSDNAAETSADSPAGSSSGNSAVNSSDSSGKQDTLEESSSGKTSSPSSVEEKPLTIGTPSSAKSVLTVHVKNQTAKGIKGFAIKDDSDEDYGENLLKAGDVFKAGEDRILYLDTASGEGSSDSADTGESETEYAVLITFFNDTTAEIHSFPLADAENDVILTDGTITYVEYTQVSTGETMSTGIRTSHLRPGALRVGG